MKMERKSQMRHRTNQDLLVSHRESNVSQKRPRRRKKTQHHKRALSLPSGDPQWKLMSHSMMQQPTTEHEEQDEWQIKSRSGKRPASGNSTKKRRSRSKQKKKKRS
eukprot:TRINITY_DN6622_c0_g1_i2.p1 TRINITY_DN6622_c0_g1~~TRINITY_DN6622_c0_g1_i2.p1  ORF type:complete len:106 (-),score=22.78 TRINITY_DN6622_c0_g1_i2:25-342(-)